jgi:uroporphyrinogen-III synthase
MDRSGADRSELEGWTVIGLRSAAMNARLGRAVRASGAAFVGLPALRLCAVDDDGALARALAAPQCLFTSPEAVRFAARRGSLRSARAELFAVGAGTAAALQRAGAGAVRTPPAGAMHSEGLLALPELDPPAAEVGLVTAPGGRGVLAATLAARGARLQLAIVYRRCPGRLDRRHRARLLAAQPPLALLLTSAEALEAVLDALPEAACARLRSASVVASSTRLVALAHRHGFERVLQASSPRWPDLRAALAGHAKAGPIR